MTRIIALEARKPAPVRGAFVQEGEEWRISFAGRTIHVNDGKGIRYLAILLRHPRRGLHVSELAMGDARGSVEATRRGGEFGDAAIGRGLGDAGETIDDRARQQYRARLRRLKAEAEGGARLGVEPSGSTREEIDLLTRELASSIGLGRRPRRSASNLERMRRAVSNRLRDAIGRIADLDARLGEHLERSVTPGVWCGYEPDRAVEWRLSGREEEEA